MVLTATSETSAGEAGHPGVSDVETNQDVRMEGSNGKRSEEMMIALGTENMGRSEAIGITTVHDQGRARLVDDRPGERIDQTGTGTRKEH
jgi:hypothetical protein